MRVLSVTHGPTVPGGAVRRGRRSGRARARAVARAGRRLAGPGRALRRRDGVRRLAASGSGRPLRLARTRGGVPARGPRRRGAGLRRLSRRADARARGRGLGRAGERARDRLARRLAHRGRRRGSRPGRPPALAQPSSSGTTTPSVSRRAASPSPTARSACRLSVSTGSRPGGSSSTPRSRERWSRAGSRRIPGTSRCPPTSSAPRREARMAQSNSPGTSARRRVPASSVGLEATSGTARDHSCHEPT